MSAFQLLLQGDCLALMRAMPDNSVDSIVTDPPYGLSFMGKKWDYDVPAVEVWAECLRVLKPGGHLLAFAGTRTQHRMAVRIEDAGFEIRDMIAWVYGSGFPKSMDVSKAIDRAAGAEREVIGIKRSGLNMNAIANDDKWRAIGTGESGKLIDVTTPATAEAAQWEGWGTALKPALEPITVARKPFATTVVANVLQHGTGALNIDECRVPHDGSGRWGAGTRPSGFGDVGAESGSSEPNGKFSEAGRWPANVIHDGSEDVLAAFPDAPGQLADASSNSSSRKTQNAYGAMKRGSEATAQVARRDAGSAARFFYCAKASRTDRNEGCESMERKPPHWSSGDANPGSFQSEGTDKSSQNFHPTVKPTDLMRYLCRLVTPPGGIVLDPFMGSGSTGKAAVREGFAFIGYELSAEYVAISRARIAAA